MLLWMLIPTAIFNQCRSIINIQGKLEWRKTVQTNWLGVAASNTPINVGGNLNFFRWQASWRYDTTTAGNQAVNITINVAGNFIMSGGTLEDYVRGNMTSSSSTLNLRGNVEITGGTWNYVRTTGTLTQVNVSGEFLLQLETNRRNITLSNTNIKNIPAGKTLTLIGNKIGNISAGRTLTVETGAKLMTGNYPVTGNRNFVMQDNSTLGMGSIDGINSNLAAYTGNVQTTGGRNYHSGGNYIYYEGGNLRKSQGCSAQRLWR
jgi:hypothetical protein